MASTVRRTDRLERDLLPWADPYIAQLFLGIGALQKNPRLRRKASDRRATRCNPMRTKTRSVETNGGSSCSRLGKLFARIELDLNARWHAARRCQTNLDSHPKRLHDRGADANCGAVQLLCAEMRHPLQRRTESKWTSCCRSPAANSQRNTPETTSPTTASLARVSRCQLPAARSSSELSPAVSKVAIRSRYELTWARPRRQRAQRGWIFGLGWLVSAGADGGTTR